MFRYHFKLSVRNLAKQWLVSGINILGLGFGMACVIIIFLFVKNEVGFNRYHKNADRIYRLINKYSVRDGGLQYSPFQEDGIAEGLKQDIPSVEYSSVFRRTNVWVENENKKYKVRIAFVHPDFLLMFSQKLLAGNLETALEKPQSVLLCRSKANSIFPGMAGDYEHMIGKSITFPQNPPNQYMVTAIIEDQPENTSMEFTGLTHFDNCQIYPRANDEFGANSVYLQLREKTDPKEAEKTVKSLIDKYVGKKLQDIATYYGLKKGEYTFTWELQPLKDIYLKSTEIKSSYERKGNSQVLYMISLIALVILFIACFNYIMLTISHSMERMKEMAVMKILGAKRKNIIRQFWSESFLLVLLAMFLGIVLAEQLLPLFNKIAGKNLNFTLYQDWSSYLFLFVVLMAIVFITSFYITTFLFVHTNPLSILRRETVISHRYGFSRLFILIQYLISVTLLVCTTVITKQLNHLRTLDVGFNRNNLVEIDVDFRKAKVDLLKTRLLENPLIEQVTTSDRTFISGSSSELFKNKKGEFIDTRILRIDKDYVKSLGLKIIDGDNVQDALPGDTILKVLVNETLVKAYRMDEPVGDFIFFDPINRYVQIVGVVKDFHYDSMKDPIMPLIMETFPYNSIWAMFVRINPENRTAALDHIRKSWEAVLPEFPYDYTFMDDLLNGQYVNEERWAKITGISALLAILLTALGLLGLTGLLVSKRTKEIGIRKVNGARVWQILVLINADFMRWVLAAIVMAIPVGWYIMTRWLRNFENRMDLSWWYFAFAGLAAILIAAATVSWRSWRYARKNPVETLKYE